MKCPECGQWNRASMPHCLRCGTPLNIDASVRPGWKESLRDDLPNPSYLRADEYGQTDSSPDARDQLAREMHDLKERKQRGEKIIQNLQNDHTEAEQGIRIEEAEGSTPDSSDDALMPSSKRFKIQRISQDGYATEREAAFRHRVRFMDDTGAFIESRSYDSVWNGEQQDRHYAYGSTLPYRVPSRAKRRKVFIRTFLSMLLICVIGTGAFFTWKYLTSRPTEMPDEPDAIITSSMMDDLAAHTIQIPGENDTLIYIRELHTSYKVTDGYATIQVADHTWYDNYEGTLEEDMVVTLTPFLKTAAGKQTPLRPITYTIDIPLSPITLDSPDSLRTEVATTISTIQITVRPGSRVTVNGEDCSDTVSSETGEMSYNATVQPIGDNVFTIVVRSQYCRDNSIEVTLYRAPQEIPLDLAVGTYGTTYEKIMKVSATTLAGAYVEVNSPHSDLDITNLDTTGKFSFNAILKTGDNTISITASYPGKKPSVVEHTVYYVPPASEYTVNAWPLSPEGYSELLSNLTYRASYGQVYKITGVVQYVVSEKPQMVVVNTSEDGKSQPVLVRNYSKTSWVVGNYYELWGDAYSSYNNMPWLNVRYTYEKKKK